MKAGACGGDTQLDTPQLDDPMNYMGDHASIRMYGRGKT